MVFLTELETYVQRTVPILTDGSQHPVVAKPRTVPDYALALLEPAAGAGKAETLP
ncbi:hypothetical protein [Halochromatium glycolicum]|uniref:hypothetical protein n=1 Tax=Halochromatium glycolicum TaxID=85075 RepID=UPI00190BB7C4|nr:hypothetical protein [Halochromatium glycolicum]